MHPLTRFRAFLACLLLLLAAHSACGQNLNNATPFPPTGIDQGTIVTSAAPTVTFALIGDYGAGGPTQARVADMVRRWLPDRILTAGDNNYGSVHSDPPTAPGGITDWTRFVGDYYGGYIKGRVDGKFPEQRCAEMRFFPVVGNHDALGSNGVPLAGNPHPSNTTRIRGYLSYFHFNTVMREDLTIRRLPQDRDAQHEEGGLSYYALRLGPVDLYCMDSDAIAGGSVPGAEAAQRAWLNARLAETPRAPWRIAVFHHPPFTSSARGPTIPMRWDELRQVDAILCGHDHLYERLSYPPATPEGPEGPPIYVVGYSGHPSIYCFSDPKDPNSRFAYNDPTRNGALHLEAASNGVKIAFRSIGADLIEEENDVKILGTAPAPGHRVVYALHLDAMQQITLATQLPVGSQLDPTLELYDTFGNPVLIAHQNHPDGLNALIRYTAPSTGLYSLKLLPKTGTGGAYQLISSAGAPGPFARWADDTLIGYSSSKKAATADPDNDGLSNLLEYAIATNPARGNTTPFQIQHTAAGLSIDFMVPAPIPSDLTWELETSSDLAAASWSRIAWREPLNRWESVATLTTELTGTKTKVTVKTPISLQRHFFRLRVKTQPSI